MDSQPPLRENEAGAGAIYSWAALTGNNATKRNGSRIADFSKGTVRFADTVPMGE